MIEWFDNLSEGWQTAIFGAGVAIVLAATGWLSGLYKWLFGSKKNLDSLQKIIQQSGTLQTAIITDDNKGKIACRDINTGIDQDKVLDRNEKAYIQLGQSEEKIKNYKAKIQRLEEELGRQQSLAEADGDQVSQPTQEAKELAAQIEDDAGPYAQALKAIAEGNNERANELLDDAQQFLDAFQQKKDEAQAKIYMARMQNARYSGRPKDALQYCDKLRSLAGDDTRILNEVAIVYYENALYKKAEPLFKQSLVIDEAAHGKDHAKVAIRLNNLAALHYATNRLTEAEPLYKRALTIWEKFLGKDHSNIATALNNLAELYCKTNRLKEAEPLYERAIKIDKAALGKNHPSVAVDLNNLAELYRKTNRLKEAETLYKQALAIDEAALGLDHPNVATRLNNLALLYDTTGRLKEAELLYKRALAIDKASFGPDHPSVAIRLNNLAGLYHKNRLKEAEPLHEQAVKIFEKTLGKDHPDIATALNNLAELYRKTNRLKEAEPLMERHLVIFLQFTRKTGYRHPHLDRAIKNYTTLLMQMGHSKDQVAAKLKKLAPEMFKQ
jgi:tetratricopeptide (TPR) repeat protein